MTKFKTQKALVLRYHEDFDTVAGEGLIDVNRDYTTTDYRWRGVHPFHEQKSADAVVDLFWKPLRHSFGHIHQHCAPFEEGLEFIGYNGHTCRIGEGHFGGYFVYPNLTVKCRGGFMGLPSHDKEVDMRIVDLYRREGDKLAENWIFIDMLHFLYMQGLDVLERMRDFPRT